MSPNSTPHLPAAFKRLGWSNLFAQFSEQVALSAAPLAAVLALSAGPAETGWLQTAQTLPFLLLSLPAGLAVDRSSRRALMAGSEALRALSLLATLLLFASGCLTLPWLAALGFVGAIGTVCYSVAAPALIPALVPRARLGDANRWVELARSAAFAGGPAVGGAIVGATGASAAYALAVALSVAATLLLAGLPKDKVEAHPRRHILHDLAEGAAFVAGHDLLRPILLTALVFNISWFVLQAVYVAYAVETLHLTATEVGFTLAVYGGGMILGAWAAPAIARRGAFGNLILVGPFCGFLASLVMLATLWAPSALVAGLSFFLFGAGPILWMISTVTLRQAVTPNAMLGRVSALIMTATTGSRPLGAALGAFLAARFGVEACLFAASLGFAVQFCIITLSQVRKLRALPEPA